MSAKRYPAETVSRARMYEVIRAPLITEKTTNGSEHSQVTFRVSMDATKPEIKQAVELMFKVEVEGVQVVNVAGKRKRFGRMAGRRPDWKKAYVRLKAGHDIDFVGGQ